MGTTKNATGAKIEGLNAMPRGTAWSICIPMYPPSINHVWRHGAKGRRVYLDGKCREFRDVVRDVILEARCCGAFPVSPLKGLLSLSVVLFPPDQRRRDVDNPNKALLDALTHCAVWIDDCQVKQLHVEMRPFNRLERGYVWLLLERLDVQKWENNDGK